jgi:AcrR family transcriptional regulator
MAIQGRRDTGTRAVARPPLGTDNTTQRVDRRVQRTERALSDSLFALIQVKNYDRVTVQDIIEHANVGRSTFYSHFDTKDDLLVSRMQEMTADLDRSILGASLVGTATADGPILPARGLFEHVMQRQPLFRALFGSSGIDLVTREAKRILYERALHTIEERAVNGASHPSPPQLRAAFLAGSLMAFVQWWLDTGLQATPGLMDEVFQRSVAGA